MEAARSAGEPGLVGVGTRLGVAVPADVEVQAEEGPEDDRGQPVRVARAPEEGAGQQEGEQQGRAQGRSQGRPVDAPASDRHRSHFPRWPRRVVGLLGRQPRRVVVEVPKRSAIASFRPKGKRALARMWAANRACWAAGSPAKAAMACSGSTLATARMAPAMPSDPAMSRSGAAPM